MLRFRRRVFWVRGGVNQSRLYSNGKSIVVVVLCKTEIRPFVDKSFFSASQIIYADTIHVFII